MGQERVSLNPIVGCTRNCPGCQPLQSFFKRQPKWFGNTVKIIKGVPRWTGDIEQRPEWEEKLRKYSNKNVSFILSYTGEIADADAAYIQSIFLTLLEHLESLPFSNKTNVLWLTRKPSLLWEKLKPLREANEYWPHRMGVGTSITKASEVGRIEELSKFPTFRCEIWFLPLLGPVGKINLSHISHVDIGGHIGPDFKSLNADWVVDIVKQCIAQGVSYRFKHGAGVKECLAPTESELLGFSQLERNRFKLAVKAVENGDYITARACIDLISGREHTDPEQVSTDRSGKYHFCHVNPKSQREKILSLLGKAKRRRELNMTLRINTGSQSKGYRMLSSRLHELKESGLITHNFSGWVRTGEINETS